VITIKKSQTADTRTCDFANVTKVQLLNSSVQHRTDVTKGLEFFSNMLNESAIDHDADKITNIEGFHRDFLTGFERTEWWDNHRKVNRHHLSAEDGVPEDVNLIDVLDMIADCVMAGMGRSGTVYPLELPDEVLKKAFTNTVELLKDQVIVAV